MSPITKTSTTSKVPSTPSTTYELAVPNLKTIASLLTGSMVDIFIGLKRRTFHLHEDLLCDRSDYFKVTFQGEFIEADSKELYLPDDNDASFELFVNWLYGGNLKRPSKDDDLQAHFGLLALAEKIMIEHLRNLAIDHIRDYYRHSNARVLARDLSFMFENTRVDRFQMAMAGLAAMQTLNSNSDGDLPADFQELITGGGEVAAAFAKYLLYSQHHGGLSRIDLFLDGERDCFYHYHDDTPQCKGSRFIVSITLGRAATRNLRLGR